MSNKRYADEFKIEAVKQVTERGHTVMEVATRLDVSQHSPISGLNASAFLPPSAKRSTTNTPKSVA